MTSGSQHGRNISPKTNLARGVGSRFTSGDGNERDQMVVEGMRGPRRESRLISSKVAKAPRGPCFVRLKEPRSLSKEYFAAVLDLAS